MKYYHLYILLLCVVLQWKTSESAVNDKGMKDAGFLFIGDNEGKIEGSAFSDTHDDTEIGDAKGIDDEDSFSISSGSGIEDKISKTTVSISKIPKNSRKPFIPNHKKATKSPAKPGTKFTSTDKDNEFRKFPINKIPDAPIKPESTTSSWLNYPENKIEPETDDDAEKPEMVENNNTANDISLMGRKTEEMSASFFDKPGILFAVIGGAIVGLLCAILLVMFIVYRMRKKDEGSYPLDEPRRSPNSNSYMRTTGKEFYA